MKNLISLAGITLLLAVSNLSAATHYVSLESTNPTPPYTNWATAATNIQDAVNVAAPNDVVVVTNGVYTTTNGWPTFPVVDVETPLTLLSVNGPQFTIIDGGGNNTCVSLTDGASLTGFTLTNAYGGVWCSSTNAFLTNCVIVGNSAGSVSNPYTGTTYFPGGGVSGGTLYNCTLTGNSAHNGGGASGSALYNCTLTGNWAILGRSMDMIYPGAGGGVSSCTLHNCTLTGNSASIGGGAESCTLYNCTLSSNWASWDRGGGASGCTLYNCILYFNTASDGANYDSNSTLNYCCTTPLPSSGVGNIDADPLFVDTNGWSNLRLQPDSPCINAGNNAYVFTATDLDGNPRILGGTVDIGAYEFWTPALLVQHMIGLVKESDLPHQRPLLASLAAALASLDRGNSIAAANQLQAFQNKVRAQVAPLDPALVSTFIQSAQKVIDALKGR